MAPACITVTLEIERKYDVPAGVAVPELTALAEVSSAYSEDQLLVATYFDTADLRLRGAGVTLRHRTGDDVTGWHLKLPAALGREELQLPGDDPTAGVPGAFRSLIRAMARGADLSPVARLTTTRCVHRLLAQDGRVLAEVVDDQVEGSLLDEGAVPVRWREWEAELGPAAERQGELLDRLEVVLVTAGATTSTTGSKVGRVLDPLAAAQRGERGDGPWWSSPEALSDRSSAAAVVQAHLREQVDELVRRDPQVRRDLPDSVHKMRVATRRLRSALKTSRPLLDREVTDPLRAELSWLAGVLGAARDAEVMRARLLDLLRAEPPELLLGKPEAKVEAALGARHRAAHTAAVAALDGERYLRLLDGLDALAASPPFRAKARGRAGQVLPSLVGRTWSRLDATMRAAERADGDEQDRLLHEARKDAKAARYAAESVGEVFGRQAKGFAAAMTDLQEVLGEHQDGVVTREILLELGAACSRAGDNGFTFCLLHAREQALADAAVARWPQVRRQVSKKALRRWLA